MTILAPIDGSESSFRALEHAIDMADRRETTVKAVHVTDYQTESTEQLTDRARGLLIDSEIGGEVEVVNRFGTFRNSSSVGNAIVEIVREHDYDHVVVGHHRTGKVGRILLGSAAREIINADEVPVTVVPSGE